MCPISVNVSLLERSLPVGMAFDTCTVGLEMFTDITFLLFLRLTLDCKYIICGNYFLVTNLVLHWTYVYCFIPESMIHMVPSLTALQLHSSSSISPLHDHLRDLLNSN